MRGGFMDDYKPRTKFVLWLEVYQDTVYFYHSDNTIGAYGLNGLTVSSKKRINHLTYMYPTTSKFKHNGHGYYYLMLEISSI